MNQVNGLPLLGFIFAETVYFSSAYYIIHSHLIPNNIAGNMFLVVVTGVFVGSAFHYLISHKRYHLSYRILTSALYFLGALLIGLGTFASRLFNAEQLIPIFIGTIAFLGACYIPLVYSLLFQVLHARHRGVASAIGEGAQALASLLALVLMKGLYFFTTLSSAVPYVVGIMLAVLYFAAFLLSLGGDKNG
jgi:hypothetical protein